MNRKVLLSGWLIFLSIAWAQLSYAQTDRRVDKVVLYNGSVIWGISELENGHIKVFLSQQDSLQIPEFMVKSIKTGKFNRELYMDRMKGVYYEVSTGALIGKSYRFSENEPSFTASFTGGYKFTRMLGVGIGVGLNYYPEQRHVPLFVDIQGDWFKGRVSPFYQFDAGWSFASDLYDTNNLERIQGGLFLRPSLGIRAHLATYSWHLKVSYVHQQSTRDFIPIELGNGTMLTSSEDRILQRAGITVGVSF
jgi:hypothetical protein